MPTEKDGLTQKLRSLVDQGGVSTETDRADAGLTTLSFQSRLQRNRHVWVDTNLVGDIVVDLEDWDDDREWDNSVDHLAVSTVSMASQLISAWLSGQALAACRNLCGQNG